MSLEDLQTEQVDVTVENHGTIFVFRLHTDAAREWADENVEVPDYMQMGPIGNGSFTCEHRCAPAIAEGMQEGGLIVR